MTLALLVNIDVQDLAAAERFYCRGLGLRVGRRFGESAVELLGASSPLYLLVKPAGSEAAPTLVQRRHYKRHWTPIHLDFVVDDIKAALERANAAGAVQEAPLRKESWGSLVLLADPFGHGFCLIQLHGRGYDEIATANEGADGA